MAAVDPPVRIRSTLALPGLARALIIAAGKLGQKSAEDIYRKAQTGKTNFIAELDGLRARCRLLTGAHHVGGVRSALVDLDAIDIQRLAQGLWIPRSARITAWLC
jgi:type IV pilus assembly protein PilB